MTGWVEALREQGRAKKQLCEHQARVKKTCKGTEQSASYNPDEFARLICRLCSRVKPSASLQLVEKLLEQAAQAEFKLAAVEHFQNDGITRGVGVDASENMTERNLRSGRTIAHPGRKRHASRIKRQPA
jgi:hypothetical protein